MQKLLINGKKELSGKISISGSKNATLPILAATILSDQVKLTNILGSEIKLLFDGVVLSKQKTIDADLSGLENGVYFITIYSEGRTVLTDKIVLFR